MRDDAPDLTPDLLLQAYRIGVFPMSESRDDPAVFWVDPRRRGILPLGGFHASRRLMRRLRSGRFRASADLAFPDVVAGCADRPETWINDTIFDLYLALHRRGQAHSVEVWEDDNLIGGVYGVAIGGAFFAESMFSSRTDASKAALFWLVDRLNAQGFRLFDTQFITPHLASLGGIEIARSEYHELWDYTIDTSAFFGQPGDLVSASQLLQRNTQMS